MAFKIKQEARHQVIAQQRLYLTSDRARVVSEGDPEAAFLLAAVGHPIPIADAKRFGLVADDVKGAEPERRSNRRATPDATR